MTDPIHSGDHHPPHPHAVDPAHAHLHAHAPEPTPRAGIAAWAWVGAAVVVVALLVWITLPPRRVALDQDCAPDGVAAALSAAVYGGSFWRAQQAALAAEIELLEGLPAAAEHGRDQQQAGAIERKMDRLSDQQASDDAAAREQALADEQHARMERMAWLARCQGPVAQHLSGGR